ncbi:hypothetical protein GCM10010492_75790 [Saccharothrix mutabilis subsp. mutabilis]|uniref:Uncharacterized protein n=1 Tax=Saccharothrix mutabilis subsp. mutabilis TaxID=66855 RepID=A0ABN0UWJ2_9PSEU
MMARFLEVWQRRDYFSNPGGGSTPVGRLRPWVIGRTEVADQTLLHDGHENGSNDDGGRVTLGAWLPVDAAGLTESAGIDEAWAVSCYNHDAQTCRPIQSTLAGQTGTTPCAA